MLKIKIISIPEGPGIPEKVRQGWVGVELEARGPLKMQAGAVADPSENHGVHEVYEVPVGAALDALKKNNETAWRWFINAPIRTPVFLFLADSCIEAGY
jgi:hypothetical protein